MAKLSIAKRPALAIGAVAIAAVAATGVAAQAKSGATTPTGTTPGHHGWGGPGHGGPGRDGGPKGRDGGAALAKALGVTTAKLQAAIESIRSTETKKDPATEQAATVKALASALGTSTDTITKVLEAQRPAFGKDHKPGGVAGTSPDYPTDTTPGPPAGAPRGTTPGFGPRGGHGGPGGPGRGGFGGPGGPGRGGPGHGGFGGPGGGFGRPGGFGLANDSALVTALAKATGKDEATVKAALTKLADAKKADHDAQEAAFAKALADKLGLDVSKVTDAIKAARPTPPVAPTTPPATTP